MTHTKGPWTAHTYNQRMGSLISFGDLSKGETIGIAYGQENEEEGKANACLIATAPDLLEELRDAQMTTYQYEQTLLALGRTEAARIYTDRYRKIKALIAKAEGR